MQFVIGPHSLGVTLQVADEVTVYVGVPPPVSANQMETADLERFAHGAALDALHRAIEVLEQDTGNNA